MDLFAALEAERVAVADLLESLSDDEWRVDSCCDGWTIEDVAAHLTVVWTYSALDYLRRSMRQRGTWFKPAASLHAINAQTIVERKAIGRPAIIADIRGHAGDRSTPSGFDARAPLTDVVVHRRDIEIPLGRITDEQPEHARPALGTATSRRYALFGHRKALAGLSFRATDIDWSTGSGPLVTGPARTLAHAMWGRPVSLDALDGEGLDILRDRLGTGV